MEVLAETVELRLIRNQAAMEAAPADSKWNIPEPDLAVLREYKPDFKHRHPRGNELILAVEVADTTLEHDAGTKRGLYARAGVPEYWILDLTYPRLLVFSELDTEKGEYASLKGYGADDCVTFASKSIPVSSLLPKT
jgi:Uma2 family endonuclease